MLHLHGRSFTAAASIAVWLLLGRCASGQSTWDDSFTYGSGVFVFQNVHTTITGESVIRRFEGNSRFDQLADLFVTGGAELQLAGQSRMSHSGLADVVLSSAATSWGTMDMVDQSQWLGLRDLTVGGLGYGRLSMQSINPVSARNVTLGNGDHSVGELAVSGDAVLNVSHVS